MNDFEKAYQRITGGKVDTRLQAYCEDIWNAAIASMQGEAELPDYILARLQAGVSNSHEQMMAATYILQTAKRIAEQAAEIARLTKELEEARKGAERWEAICNLWFLCSELKLIQNEDGGYSICEMEFVDNLLVSDFCGDTPEQAIDAAISKIGGGE